MLIHPLTCASLSVQLLPAIMLMTLLKLAFLIHRVLGMLRILLIGPITMMFIEDALFNAPQILLGIKVSAQLQENVYNTVKQVTTLSIQIDHVLVPVQTSTSLTIH